MSTNDPAALIARDPDGHYYRVPGEILAGHPHSEEQQRVLTQGSGSDAPGSLSDLEDCLIVADPDGNMFAVPGGVLAGHRVPDAEQAAMAETYREDTSGYSPAGYRVLRDLPFGTANTPTGYASTGGGSTGGSGGVLRDFNSNTLPWTYTPWGWRTWRGW